MQCYACRTASVIRNSCRIVDIVSVFVPWQIAYFTTKREVLLLAQRAQKQKWWRRKKNYSTRLIRQERLLLLTLMLMNVELIHQRRNEIPIIARVRFSDIESLPLDFRTFYFKVFPLPKSHLFNLVIFFLQISGSGVHFLFFLVIGRNASIDRRTWTVVDFKFGFTMILALILFSIDYGMFVSILNIEFGCSKWQFNARTFGGKN